MSQRISCWTARSIRAARCTTVDVPEEIQRKMEKLSTQHRELERARNKAMDSAEQAVANLDSFKPAPEAPTTPTAAINPAPQSSGGGGKEPSRDASPLELRGSGWRNRLAAGSRQAALSPAGVSIGAPGCQSVTPFRSASRYPTTVPSCV